MQAALIYPHQLYHEHPATRSADLCVLVEEPLLFKQYDFHRQKLLLQRLAMKRYAQELAGRGLRVHYVAASELQATADIVPARRRLE